MRTVILVCVYALVLVVGGLGYATSTAEAAIPKYINFQGKLTQVSNGNNVVNGTYSFKFRLYDDPTAGSLLWTETYDQVPTDPCQKIQVTNGVFNTKLGTCNSLAGVDFTGGELYLTIDFDPGSGYDGEMSPRKQLVSSAYAFVANGVSGDGAVNTTSTSSTALTVANQGTGYSFQVDNSTASADTGLKVTSADAGSGLAVAVISSGSNENLTLDAKGSGTISLGATSTGNLILGGATGDILLGGGSSSTGCTVTNSSGAFACTAGGSFTTLGLTGAITGAASYNGLIVTANTGVITTGTWNATAIGAQYGGTGLNTSASTGVPIISSGTWSVSSQLGVSLGGTGVATFAANGVLYGNSASAIQATAQGGANTVLVANAGAPSFSAAITVGTSVTSPTINATTALQLNGTSINTAGTLTNVAYLNQANAFTANQSITNATITNGSKLVTLTGTATTSTSSGTGYGLYNSFTNANTTNADTAYANYTTVADATALANTVYGDYQTIALSGNAAKIGVGQYATVSTSSTTADTIIALDAATSAAGIIGSGTRSNYGVRLQPASTSVNTGGTQNIYGVYSNPSTTLSNGSTENVYGGYFKASGTVAASGIVNSYGLYVANPSMNTTGTTKKYGLYVEDITTSAADTNYAAVFAGGNVGIGTVVPEQKLVIGLNQTNVNQGIPATSGSTQNGALRIASGPGGLGFGEVLDIGLNVSNSYGWLQVTNVSNLAVNYSLALNPNGGNVGVGDSTPASLFTVGSGDLFQVNSSGAIAAVVGITNTGSYTQTGTGTLSTGTGAISLNGLTTISKTITANSGTTNNLEKITFTTPADTSGTQTHQGLNIATTIGNASAGTNTANIIGIDAISGDAQVSLNALKVGDLTGTAAAEYALNIGSGWDDVLRVNGTQIINGTGVLQSTALSGSYTGITGVGTLTVGTWNATAIGAQYGGTGINTSASTGVPSISAGTWSVNAQLGVALGGTNIASYTIGDMLYASGATTLSKLGIGSANTILTSTGSAPQWTSSLSDSQVSDTLTASLFVGSGSSTTAVDLGTAEVAGTLTVAKGGTNCSVASITCFNNITGFTAAGTTGTTSTNLVFSTSPTLVTPVLGAATYTTLTGGTVNVSTGNAYQINSQNVIQADTSLNNYWLAGAGNLTANAGPNLGIGPGTLGGVTNGGYNTAVGFNSMTGVVTGTDNASFGVFSLQANTSGAFNTALGSGALAVNSVGSYNTSVGRESLGSNVDGSRNTAVGYRALYAMDPASAINTSNTAIGYLAGTAVTTGTNNTLVGTGAGQSITTGTGNTIVGMNINGTTGLTNNIILGSGGTTRAQFDGTDWNITGTLQPSVDGGYALGSSSYRWSNLFLSNGGVANFGNDATLTHSTDLLTLDGADLVIGAQGDATAGGFTIQNNNVGEFGGETNRDGVSSFAVFNGKLYAATSELDGSSVYIYDGGNSWTKITDDPGKVISSDSANIDAMVLTVFNGKLYAGTQTGADTAGVYSYDGSSWAQLNGTLGTLGSEADIDGISDLAVYDGLLFVATGDPGGDADSGNVYVLNSNNVFAITNTDNLGACGDETAGITTGKLAVYNHRLFWGAGSYTGGDARLCVLSGITSSHRSWYPLNGLNQVSIGTFIDTGSIRYVSSMTVHNGRLFFGVYGDGDNSAEIYSMTLDETLSGDDKYEPTASYRHETVTPGLIDEANDADQYDSVPALRSYNGRLYAAGASAHNVGQVYEFDDTTRVWTHINSTAGEFGSETNVNDASALIAFNGSLYVGTYDDADNIGSVYVWSKTYTNSYALKFDSGGGNYASISFVGAETGQNNTSNMGSFLFSHGIVSTTGAYDLAEDYPTREQGLVAGDVLSLDPHESGLVIKTPSAYDKTVVGIYSTNPGLRLSQVEAAINGLPTVPVALAGRVPVNVAPDSPPILPGDYVVSSGTYPGKAMKASASGPVIGKALEVWNPNTSQTQVLVLVNLSWNGATTTDPVNLTLAGMLTSRSIATGDVFGDLLKLTRDNIGESFKSTDANLQAGDLVTIDPSHDGFIMKANIAGSTAGPRGSLPPMGVVGSEAGLLLGASRGAASGNQRNYPVIITGRSQVKVTNENGNIQPGDFLTASATRPGFAMRATQAGTIIGQALESMNDDEGIVTSFIKPNSFNGLAIEDQIEGGVTFDYNDPEQSAETSSQILQHLLSQLPNLNFQNLSEVNTDLVVAGAEVISPNVTTHSLRTDLLSAATTDGSLVISSTVMFNGGLLVDTISPIGDLLSFQGDVEFFGTPYFTTDTAGFAVIKAGVQSVDVEFTRQYLAQPIVNASFSFEQDGEGSEETKAANIAQARTFLGEGITFVITNKSDRGFTIVLNRPASTDVKFSWTAFAVRNATTFMSLDYEGPRDFAPETKTDDGQVAGDTTNSAEENSGNGTDNTPGNTINNDSGGDAGVEQPAQEIPSPRGDPAPSESSDSSGDSSGDSSSEGSAE